jgi:hypothetical protein
MADGLQLAPAWENNPMIRQSNCSSVVSSIKKMPVMSMYHLRKN